MAGTIDLLLDYMEENGYTPENCSLVIGYCYGYEEAESFQKMLMQSLEEKFEQQRQFPFTGSELPSVCIQARMPLGLESSGGVIWYKFKKEQGRQTINVCRSCFGICGPDDKQAL